MEQFEEIYREHYSRIYGFLFKLSGSADTAEELTQETFLQAFRSFHRFRGDCRLSTWLAAIAKHVYYQHLRKHRLGLEAISLDYLADTYCANTLGSPEDEAVRRGVADSIRRIIDRIPEKYRDVVILRVYGDMPFAQVAKTLGITESSAKVIFFRAKKMLMEELRHELAL